MSEVEIVPIPRVSVSQGFSLLDYQSRRVNHRPQVAWINSWKFEEREMGFGLEKYRFFFGGCI